MTVAPTFREAGGQVVLEAEHFNLQTGRGQRAWINQDKLAGYVGPGYVTMLPDNGGLVGTSQMASSPELQYTLYLSTTGVYTLWLRGYVPDGGGDSVYVGLSGGAIITPTIKPVTGFAPRQWTWAKQTLSGEPVTFQVAEPGLRTLHLWMREDGLRLDRLVMTTDGTYVPTGDGPN